MNIEELLVKYGYPIVLQDKFNFKILCPFHDDNKPSLAVHKDSGIFKCWSCGAKGNIVSLIAKIEGVSYDEAKEKLKGNNVEIINNPYLKKEDKKLTLEQRLYLKYLEIIKLLNLLYFHNEESKYWLKQWKFLKDEPLYKEIINRQIKLKKSEMTWELAYRQSFIKYLIETCELYAEKFRYQKLIEGFQNAHIKEDLTFINMFLSNEKIINLIIEADKLRLTRFKLNLLLEALRFKLKK